MPFQSSKKSRGTAGKHQRTLSAMPSTQSKTQLQMIMDPYMDYINEKSKASSDKRGKQRQPLRNSKVIEILKRNDIYTKSRDSPQA